MENSPLNQNAAAPLPSSEDHAFGAAPAVGIPDLRVLLVGCGRMGTAHALAFQNESAGFRIAGLVSRKDGSRERLARRLGGAPALFDDLETALRVTRPDAVCISTHSDTHAELALRALRAGAHVYVEKPLALTLRAAEDVLVAAGEVGRQLMVGYLLHHHPAQQKFLELGEALGRPLVMRMAVNQPSAGPDWERHRRLLASASSLVDCGVHYVDLMGRLTGAAPLRVHAVGARLDESLRHDNYGQVQIVFADGSVGWFESGWGPMIGSGLRRLQEATGPRGAVSLLRSPDGSASTLVRHRIDTDGSGRRVEESWTIPEEPSLSALCARAQGFFREAISGRADLRANHRSARESLRIVLAAQRSCELGETVRL